MVRIEPPSGGFFVAQETMMKLCKCCRSLMIGHDASQWHENLSKLMSFHGFRAKTIPDIANSLGPMCIECQKVWSKQLTAR